MAGSGTYNDNGVNMPIGCGDVTFTLDGSGHGISNTGSEMLKFIALTVLE